MSPQGPPHPGFPRDWEVGRGLGVGLEPRAESEPHLTPWRRAVVVAAAGLLGRGHGGHGWRSAQLALLGGRWSSRGDGKGVNAPRSRRLPYPRAPIAVPAPKASPRPRAGTAARSPGTPWATSEGADTHSQTGRPEAKPRGSSSPSRLRARRGQAPRIQSCPRVPLSATIMT